MTARHESFLLFFIIIVLWLPLDSPTTAKPYDILPIVVNPGQSIQAAINGAPENSTILVEPGTYVERIRIDKALTLTGRVGFGGSTVVQSQVSGKIIEIPRGTNGVTVANLLINGSKDQFSTGVFIGSLFNTMENVTVTNNRIGVHIYDSSENLLRNNRLQENTFNLRVFGLYLEHFLHDIDSSNLVDGRKVYYWISRHNEVFPTDGGYVAAINCSNVTVENMSLTNSFSGVLFAYTDDSFIRNVTSQRNEQGIRLLCSTNNIIENNTSILNEWSGISLTTSPNNHIKGNQLKSNQHGIYLSYSDLISTYTDNNEIWGNTIANNSRGMYLDKSSKNEIFENEITSNFVGIELIDQSQDSAFYHNNFINNAENVDFYPGSPTPANTWDSGYPSAGNFWSEYNGTDAYSGLHQNQTGIDGIGDTEFAIAENNLDRYPLTHSYGSIRNLNTSLTYLTLQSAINAPETLNRHIIYAKSGTYREPVVITKSISLIAQSKENTIIETKPTIDVITLTANNVTVSNFHLNCTDASPYSFGVRLVNSCHSTVTNNVITRKLVAVMLENGSCHNLVQNNLMTANQYGVFIKRNSNLNVIFNNSILNNGWNGIELAYCEGNIIEANTIAGNGGYGLEIPIYTPSIGNRIFHNNFLNNSWNYPIGAHASDFYPNSWDSDGEGNFWDDYVGNDLDQDGIGNSAYFINPSMENIVVDRYPLAGRFSAFRIYGQYVSTISNSSIDVLGFSIEYPNAELSLNVTQAFSHGFLRLCFSRGLLDLPVQFEFDGGPINDIVRRLPKSNEIFEFVYIPYPTTQIGKHLIRVSGTTQIPELPSVFTFAIISIITLFLMKFRKRSISSGLFEHDTNTGTKQAPPKA